MPKTPPTSVPLSTCLDAVLACNEQRGDLRKEGLHTFAYPRGEDDETTTLDVAPFAWGEQDDIAVLLRLEGEGGYGVRSLWADIDNPAAEPRHVAQLQRVQTDSVETVRG